MISKLRVKLFCIASYSSHDILEEKCFLVWVDSAKYHINNAVNQRVLQMQNASRRARGNIAHGWRWYNWLCGIALCVLCVNYVCGSWGWWSCRVVHILTLFIVMLSYMGCWIYWLLCLQIVWDTKKQQQHGDARTWIWALTNDGSSSHPPQVCHSSFNVYTCALWHGSSSSYVFYFLWHCLVSTVCAVTWSLGQTFMLEMLIF